MTADLSGRPSFSPDRSEQVDRPATARPLAELAVHAPDAAAFLKALSHEGRLLILCHLSEGEKSVTELEEILGVRQAAVSQQLARLRIEGLVSTRRDGKSIYYTIRDPKVGRTVALMYDLFCRPDATPDRDGQPRP